MANNENLEVLLRQVCKVHTNKVNRVLDEVGLHIGQPMMLRLLYKKDGVPQTILARELVITPATASAMVKRLEKGGYVIRKRDAEDERVSNVYLTDKGRDISTQLRDVKDKMDELVFDGFSEEERKTMRSYLERALENMKD
ncbi:MAG: MarR family transcriptional regulator [Gudongella sp.]|nr:MarR family transcriptional regulator [Gudongella sp.]